MKISRTLLIVMVVMALAIVKTECDPEPPIYADSFEVRMDETWIKDGTKYRVYQILT